ncbi:indian hedgehog protein-like [Acanthaster planci]|uniref:Hedgehog protein n=1 Tax=Acanthaster planci TaxID=133434 RepID=A0A8B7YEM7_ACAPL|nr:indian hedgehog protein-like [Acanthaster planci]XP_022090857.1 indian hedgehog protein-like [Acanthaster planci]
MPRADKLLLTFFLAWLLLSSTARACTGRASQQSKVPRQSTPLTLRQRVPNVSENTLGASGPPEGRIHRDNPKFDELLPPNNNADILYKDEEGTGADRRMSKRCKDKLNSLAISVMNQWPGILLRVTEAWDEDGHHDENSLHYEGRAVDITTSDKDRSKYGMLARLAVEAGFDWVSFESKTWVHCSVKADSSEAARSGGCFPADSVVTLQNGETRTMADLQIGDKVKVVDKSSGLVTFSDVITFMDRNPTKDTLYRIIMTDRPGYTVTLTPQHVLYVSDTNSTFTESRAVFASDVQTGQYLYTTVHDHDREGRLRPVKVTGVSTVWKPGAVAPLTYQGTLIVDGVAASNYAVLDVDWVSHGVFAPLRWWYSIRQYLGTPVQKGLPTNDQIHWYPAFMYTITKPIFGSWYHPDALDV